MGTEAVDLVEETGMVRGVRFRAPDGPGEVRAALTVAADGRRSVLRERAGLPRSVASPPIDVIWFRLPHPPGETNQSLGVVGDGHVLAMIDRGDYWQCGFTISKGGADALRAEGIEALQHAVASAAPELADRVGTLRGWDQVSVLSVQADRLRRWHRPGLLCIGDAAHAMSPVGGVGINFAIQDAVAAANLLAEPLRRGRVTERDLARVQRHRAWQVRAMQLVQARMLNAALARSRPASGGPAASLRALGGRLFGGLARRFVSRLIGLGVRRTRLRAPAAE
jgi:2-polyprenyl-6-methoxyphenol hydroxylase-like FAD-dependent oxidoreductase